jgi:Dynein heavy chain C-terminal domain
MSLNDLSCASKCNSPLLFFSLLSQGFMTASLQTYAREHLEAIDNLSFAYKILSVPPEEITVAPSDGVIVFGIYLEV